MVAVAVVAEVEEVVEEMGGEEEEEEEEAAAVVEVAEVAVEVGGVVAVGAVEVAVAALPRR